MNKSSDLFNADKGNIPEGIDQPTIKNMMIILEEIREENKRMQRKIDNMEKLLLEVNATREMERRQIEAEKVKEPGRTITRQEETVQSNTEVTKKTNPTKKDLEGEKSKSNEKSYSHIAKNKDFSKFSLPQGATAEPTRRRKFVKATVLTHDE